MTSRERIWAAITHQPVDRVPAMIWATPEVRQMLLQHFRTDDWAVVEEILGVDGIAHVPLRYAGPGFTGPDGGPAGLWGVHVCKMVDSQRVALLYDINHMQIMEGDQIRTIQNNIQWFKHFHTAGNPGRHDMDDQQEIYYPAVARAIAELDYQGYVGHELGTKGEDRIAAAQAAYATWNEA